MLVIPAIDLKDGRCVRLRQGDMAAETVYSDDVPAVARQWQQAGASLIHVVDLNGAVDGQPRNLPQIEAIEIRHAELLEPARRIGQPEAAFSSGKLRNMCT